MSNDQLPASPASGDDRFPVQAPAGHGALAQRLAGNQVIDHFLLLADGFQTLLDLLLIALDLDQGA